MKEVSKLKNLKLLSSSDKIKTAINSVDSIVKIITTLKSLPVIGHDSRITTLSVEEIETRANVVAVVETYDESTSTPCWWDIDEGSQTNKMKWSDFLRRSGTNTLPKNHGIPGQKNIQPVR